MSAIYKAAIFSAVETATKKQTGFKKLDYLHIVLHSKNDEYFSTYKVIEGTEEKTGQTKSPETLNFFKKIRAVVPDCKTVTSVSILRDCTHKQVKINFINNTDEAKSVNL